MQTISYTYNGYGEISKKVKTYGGKAKEAGKQTEEKITGSGESSVVGSTKGIAVSKASEENKGSKNIDSTEEMQYNTVNQLTSYQGKEVEYDAYGNMTKGPVKGSMAAYTYDSRNRLSNVLDISYEYDAENNRIASKDSQTGKTIRYIHNTNSDLSQLLVEEDGTTTTKYVYGNELISAKVYNKSLEELKNNSAKATADITYYYHYDNLKSTTLLTDETGEVIETYDYGTYGEVMEGDTTLTRFLYNGGLGVSSDSTGLYYMRARYYNPVIRRFINQDVETGSMDNSASLNRYAYVQGNPVSLTDPFGLSPDMEYGNYEANALKALYKVADKVADYLPVVGTARDIKRSYNAFKNGNTADGIKHGATAALSLAVPTAKLATKAMKTTLKLAKNALKAEKNISKTAEIATEGIRLAGKAGKTGRLAEKAGSVSAKIAKSVKNGVSSVARTVKTNAAKVFKKERKREKISNNDSNKTLLSGEEWYRYFQNTYGVDNVNWSVNSWEDIVAHPTSLRGYNADEIGEILGDGWSRGEYGKSGTGWKFIEKKHPDKMVFYHAADGRHGGEYWGVTLSGKNKGRIKVVDTDTYLPASDDNATIIYKKDW